MNVLLGGAVIVHKARLLIACGRRGGREHPPLTHIQSNACRFLFLLFSYLRFAEAASFDKKELCRSDTLQYYVNKQKVARITIVVPRKQKAEKLYTLMHFRRRNNVYSILVLLT